MNEYKKFAVKRDEPLLPNPLLKVKLADNPSPETLEAIGFLVDTDVEAQDQIFKAWGNEIYLQSKELLASPELVDKQKFIEDLKGARPLIQAKLDTVVAAILNNESSFKTDRDKKYFEDISYEIWGEEEIVYLKIYQKNDYEAIFGWSKTEDKSFQNIHREVDPALQGSGVGHLVEEVFESAARKAGIKVIHFHGWNTNAGITYPLSQNYYVRSRNHRLKMPAILSQMFASNKPPNQFRDSGFRDLIKFSKKL